MSNHEKRPAQASHAPLGVFHITALRSPCLLCDFGCRSTDSSFCIRLDVFMPELWPRMNAHHGDLGMMSLVNVVFFDLINISHLI